MANRDFISPDVPLIDVVPRHLQSQKADFLTRFVSKLPILGPTWDRLSSNRRIRYWLDEAKLTMRYGRLFPDAIQLPNSQSNIFVDRSEPRGRSVLLCRARGQPNLKRLWHRAVELMQPDVVLDVGANYGEFIFAERYPAAERVIGIEANPALEPFLKRSREVHPDRQKIQILNALAAERSDEEHVFYVDSISSGRSSAVQRHDSQTVATKTRSVAIDDLVKDIVQPDKTIVFKIDVEGYEPMVLSGMKQTLGCSARLLGIMEFNPRLIRLSGADPEVFLAQLFEMVAVYALPHAQPSRRLVAGTLAEIQSLENCDEIELDILLCSHSLERSEKRILDQILQQ